MYTGVVFDFDGVLVDSERLQYQTICHTLRYHAVKFDFFHYRTHYLGMHDVDLFRRINVDYSIGLTGDEIHELIDLKRTTFQRRESELVLCEGILECIHALKDRSISMAICSSSKKETIQRILRNVAPYDLNPFFKTIIGVEDVLLAKPEPEGYVLAGIRIRKLPRDCIAVEDSPVGIQAAKRAGMYTIGVTTNYDASHLTEADAVVDVLSVEKIETLFAQEEVS